MRYLLTLLLGLIFPLLAHSSIKKATPTELEKAPSKELKEIYTKAGNLNLAAIFELPVGAKVEFRLPDNEGTCLGEVTSIVIKENDRIMVIGKISEKDNSGFVFVATTTKSVGGALFFPKQGISYTLKYDQEKDFFLLEKRKLK